MMFWLTFIIHSFYLFIIKYGDASTFPDFPLAEFLNTSIENILRHYARYNLCYETKLATPENRCCDCSKTCFKEYSCCADVLWRKKKYANVSEYTKDLLHETLKYRYQECIQTTTHWSAHHYMIASCPNEADPDDAYKCQYAVERSSFSLLPVRGDDDYVYKNFYCAKCNSIKRFSSIQITTLCNDKIKKSDCFDILSENGYFLPTCKVALPPGNCQPESKYHDLCHAFRGPMDGYKRNYFCHVCDDASYGLKDPGLSDSLPCTPAVNLPEYPHAWSTFLQFEEPDENIETDAKQCSSTFLPDLKGMKCFFCPQGYESINGDCVSAPSLKLYDHDADFNQCLARRAISISINESDSFCSYGMNNYLSSTSRNFSNMTFIKVKIPEVKKNITLYLEQVVEDSCKRNQLYLGPTEFPINHSKLLNVSHIFPTNKVCASPYELQKGASFDSDCHIHTGNVSIQNDSIALWITVTNGSIKKHIFACKEFFYSKQCAISKNITTNFTLLENRSLIHENENTINVYDISKYYPLKNGYFTVCDVNEINIEDPQWLQRANFIEGYLSVIGSSMSIMCHILLISFHFVLSELKTIPGRCVMLLSIFLLIGDGLFILTNIFRPSLIGEHLCNGIGIIMHLCLLVAQFWGGIMTYDIAVMINSRNIEQNQDGRKIILRYMCFVVSVASLIIIIGVTLRGFGVLDGSYTRNGVCFLHGYYSRITLYYAPLLGTSILSIVVLTKIIYDLERYKKSRKKLFGDQWVGYCVPSLALKVVVICGLPECIGLMNIDNFGYYGNGSVAGSFINILYSLVKSFRGVMLFFVYVGRKRFVQIIKGRASE